MCVILRSPIQSKSFGAEVSCSAIIMHRHDDLLNARGVDSNLEAQAGAFNPLNPIGSKLKFSFVAPIHLL